MHRGHDGEVHVERSRCLARLRLTVAAVAQRRWAEEAARAGWPLPDGLRLHLWLYALGLAAPTNPDGEEGVVS